MKPFIQIQNQESTLEHWKQILAGNKLDSFAAFAYVTDSGVAQIRTYLSGHLGKSRNCRWLFSFDYGRSHPTALRKLKEFGKSSIRIYDGEYVVQSKSFIPRVSYHLKTVLTLQSTGYPCQQIVGSGNLSASGLLSGIEAGCIVDYSEIDQRSDVLTRRLRHGNNEMEKLTLPIPEEYGYQSYDGKILTFEIDGDKVALEAFEPDDFFRIYGMRISSTSEMRGGRKYGTVALS